MPSGPGTGRSCDLFNLRLSKCGGFIPSLRLAQFARQHGLGYQLGCQIGETAILSAAGRHFASCGARHSLIWKAPTIGIWSRKPWARRDMTFGWGGWARALTAPGLGVDVDQAALERVAVRQEELP